jgi:Tol biopolymer transport system component
VPPEPEVSVVSLAVTPDGNAVDFARGVFGDLSLWRVPLLGGAPRKIVDDVNSAPGWSADGKRMAFVRSGGVSPTGDSVIVADADGVNARVLAARTRPSGYSGLSRVGRPDVRPISPVE